jgi:hypothetical protein
VCRMVGVVRGLTLEVRMQQALWFQVERSSALKVRFRVALRRVLVLEVRLQVALCVRLVLR